MITPWSALSAAITRLNDRVNALPAFREATVTALDPVSVRFDTDTDYTLVQGNLAADLLVGHRVLTVQLRHYVWVLGRRHGGSGDSGWVLVPLESGFSGNLFIRKIGDDVWMRGNITGSLTAGATTQVAQLPGGYSPSQSAPMPAIFSNGEYNWGSLSTTGNFSVRKTTTGSSTLLVNAHWKQ